MLGAGWIELLVAGLVSLLYAGSKRLPEIGKHFTEDWRELQGVMGEPVEWKERQT